ncbi:hypothetical protein MC885_021602 [Smutsia gigantea]|nr:hypothetical protein MC885_021602 [Smutsia gigantea]
MGHNPHPSPTYHLLGCPGIVLHPLYRHDAAFQVCPAANSPLQRLGHLVREDMSPAEASQSPAWGCQQYLEGGRDREAHEAGAEMGLAQHSAHGSHKHQPVSQELQAGCEPPARGGR